MPEVLSHFAVLHFDSNLNMDSADLALCDMFFLLKSTRGIHALSKVRVRRIEGSRFEAL
jgi:hypothetical protein